MDERKDFGKPLTAFHALEANAFTKVGRSRLGSNHWKKCLLVFQWLELRNTPQKGTEISGKGLITPCFPSSFRGFRFAHRNRALRRALDI